MATTSKDHWRKRMLEIARRTWKAEETIQKSLGGVYTKASKELQKQLEAFYGRYAEDNRLTLEQAKKKIKQTDISDWQEEIQRLTQKKDLTEEEEEQLALLGAKFATNRLELLINEMELQLIETYGKQQITMAEWLKRVAAETYRETSGVVGSFARLPVDEVRMIVEYPWSGAEFSDILWKNKDQLIYNLQRVITTGLIRGDGVQQIARALRQEVESSRYASERLIRTETGYVMNQATLKGYADNGVKEYVFSAHIDGRTSKTCRGLDGHIFKVSEAQVGTNLPPMHPSCRSTIYPEIGSSKSSEKVNREWYNQNRTIQLRDPSRYSEEYLKKLHDQFDFFKQNGYLFKEHALNRVLGQKKGKGKRSFTRDDVIDVLKNGVKYYQENGHKKVYFKDAIAIIRALDTGEIVSIVSRPKPKKDWREWDDKYK